MGKQSYKKIIKKRLAVAADKVESGISNNVDSAAEKHIQALEVELINVKKRIQYLEEHIRSSFFGPDPANSTHTPVNPSISAILAMMIDKPEEEELESRYRP